MTASFQEVVERGAGTDDVESLRPSRSVTNFVGSARRAGWTVRAKERANLDGDAVLVVQAIRSDAGSSVGVQSVRGRWLRHVGKDELLGFEVIVDGPSGGGWHPCSSTEATAAIKGAPMQSGYRPASTAFYGRPKKVAKAKQSVPKPRIVGHGVCPMCRREIGVFRHDGHLVWSSHNSDAHPCSTVGMLLCQVPAKQRHPHDLNVPRCGCARQPGTVRGQR